MGFVQKVEGLLGRYLVFVDGPGAVLRPRAGRLVQIRNVGVGEVVRPRSRAAFLVAHNCDVPAGGVRTRGNGGVPT